VKDTRGQRKISNRLYTGEATIQEWSEVLQELPRGRCLHRSQSGGNANVRQAEGGKKSKKKKEMRFRKIEEKQITISE